jgi:hypothetical protein
VTSPPMFAKNLSIKLMSLLLALALWVMASGAREEERTFSVPVILVNKPSGLAVESRVPPAVEITVIARRIRFLRVHPERMSLELDLKKVGEGTVSFSGMEKRLRLPPEFTVVRVYPAVIELKLIRTAGKKT